MNRLRGPGRPMTLDNLPSPLRPSEPPHTIPWWMRWWHVLPVGIFGGAGFYEVLWSQHYSRGVTLIVIAAALRLCARWLERNSG